MFVGCVLSFSLSVSSCACSVTSRVFRLWEGIDLGGMGTDPSWQNQKSLNLPFQENPIQFFSVHFMNC